MDSNTNKRESQDKISDFDDFYNSFLKVLPERKKTIDEYIRSHAKGYPFGERGVTGLGSSDPNHPINNLNNIWEEIQKNTKNKIKIKRKLRKKNKKNKIEIEKVDYFQEILNNCSCKNNLILRKKKSKKEIKNHKKIEEDDEEETDEEEEVGNNDEKINKKLEEKEINLNDKLKDINKKLTKQPKYSESTNQSNDNLTGKGVIITNEEINKYKLNKNEIKSIPLFSSYDPGSPSNRLYVKNLSRKASYSELNHLFNRFRDSNGESLMTDLKTFGGKKMRNQIFVTYKDNKTANEALDLLHGYIFKNKPLIIQFGNHGNQKTFQTHQAMGVF